MKLINLLVKELPNRGGWPEGVKWIGQDYDCELMFYGMGNVRTGIFLNVLAENHRGPGERASLPCKVNREQYESALAASEGWIEWGGGECPVEEGTLVDVRFRDGDDGINIEAKNLHWFHKNWSADIISYRLHKPDFNSRANDDRLEQDLNECIGQDVDMPEWSGDGLPPVGCECEVRAEGVSDDYGWVKVKIAYAHNGELIGIVNMPGESIHDDMCKLSYGYNGAQFRPLHTEAEKVREKLAASLHVAAGAIPIEVKGIGPLYFELADAIISGSIFGTTFKAEK